jgi:hypothetical protein
MWKFSPLTATLTIRAAWDATTGSPLLLTPVQAHKLPLWQVPLYTVTRRSFVCAEMLAQCQPVPGLLASATSCAYTLATCARMRWC